MAGLIDLLSFWQKGSDKELKIQLQNPRASFAPPEDVSGAKNVIIDKSQMGSYGGGRSLYNNDYGLAIETTKQLINTYRTVAENHEVDDAIQQLIDEAIVEEDDTNAIELNLDDTNFSEAVKEKIQDQFNYILKLYNFRKNGSTLFRKWYVDSRIYVHKIIDPKSKELTELRVIDPVNMQLIKEIIKEDKNGESTFVGINEYYEYIPNHSDNSGYSAMMGISKGTIKLPKNAITYVPSGLIDATPQKNVIGYLHRAIKVTNQLKMLEDALVIYRLARAPERRVFYVDVGSLPNSKAKQYVNDIMNSMKNRIVYDSSSGKIKNTTAAMSMMEDIYLPRREGSKGTEVSTLPGAASLGEIGDLEYFNRKLYKAMRLPKSRSGDDAQKVTMFGSNITDMETEELNFIKFIRRLQVRFEDVILDPLLHQVVVKKIIDKSDWKINKEFIKLRFNKDSNIEESKRNELLERKFGMLRDIDEYTGSYISKEYVYKNVLNMTEEEIEHERKQIKCEIAAGDIKVEDDY